MRVARPSEILKAVRACATRGWRGTENRGERKLRGSGLRVSPRADVCRPCPLACASCEREKFIHTRASTHIHTYTLARIHTRVYSRPSWIRVYHTCRESVTYRQYFHCPEQSLSLSLFLSYSLFLSFSRCDPLTAAPGRKGVRDARIGKPGPRFFTGIRDAVVTFDRAASSPSDTLSSTREEKLISAGWW